LKGSILNKKVSIIMPCYNCIDSIYESVKSVLNQTYENFELIVVDDHSMDGTWDELVKFSNSDSRIKITRLPTNTGSPIAPRNLALERATGDFVCFLDSDDRWESSKLEVQLEFMVKNDIRFSYSPYQRIKDSQVISTYTPPVSVSYNKLLQLNVIGCLTVCIDYELIKNERFNNIKLEDYDFWLRILKQNKLTAYTCSNESLARYTIQSDSRSSNKIGLLRGYFDIFDKLLGSKGLASFYTIRYIIHFAFKYK